MQETEEMDTSKSQSVKQVYEHISQELPDLIFLTGKTSTGKSTFANSLNSGWNYHIVELDQIVHKSVLQPLGLTDVGNIFVEVYRNRTEEAWLRRFVKATRAKINSYMDKRERVIIEGALANPQTLQEIVEGFPHFKFVYFHPENLDVYTGYLTARFMQSDQSNNASLPKGFWDFIDKQEFEKFCKTRIVSDQLADSIRQYAMQSQLESKKRLELFGEYFAGIEVVVP